MILNSIIFHDRINNSTHRYIYKFRGFCETLFSAAARLDCVVRKRKNNVRVIGVIGVIGKKEEEEERRKA